MSDPGKLILVPTPIGNMEDITYRAERILRESDLVLAEDTRKTGQLLKKLDIQARMQSYHAFNEHKVLDQIINRLKRGENMALVTDAGTPAISDPGFLIVRTCLDHGILVECLPGPTALIPALAVSGLPCDKFVFEGFLPHKKGRMKRLESLKNEERTMVFYESPHRIIKTLEQFQEHFGESRRISVSREISKVYEETIRGDLRDVTSQMKGHSPKGEFVIVVAGKDTK